MPMELFTKLFGDLLIFVYHRFDRIVIHGYLSGLSRPEPVVHFFRQILGLAVWNGAEPSASASPSTPPRIPTIASWPTSAAVTLTTTSTSAMRCWW
jgi:hypothetical protein